MSLSSAGQSPRRPRVIAIDGVLGSGKSTVSRRVATALGLAYLDTGAMYRVVALATLRRGFGPDNLDPIEAARVAADANYDVSSDEARGAVVTLDGGDVSKDIRTPEVSRMASVVAAIPEVRVELVRRQREWVNRRAGGVLEGRDIASVVFPDAALKVFLTASVDERVRRRYAETPEVPIEKVRDDLLWRDRNDSTRAADPLKVVDGATTVDTTGLSVDDVVARILALVPPEAGT